MSNSASESADSVVLIGAGLAGCLLATLLGRRGIEVTVYERRADPRVAGAERGRSINLALSARGLDALERVGLREHALESALPMPGRMVHPVTGVANFQPYSADGTRAINSISRSGLNEALLESAESTPDVTIVFEHRLEHIDLDTGALRFSTPDGPQAVWTSVVLACDGAYSATRKAIESQPGFALSEGFLEQGYKELTIPAKDGDFALDPKALHIWARGQSMMIALPNQDRSFTCTLFWPKEDFEALTSPDDIAAHFRCDYPDVVDLMPTLVEDYRFNPVGSLVTVRCWPWTASGNDCQVGLVGDAAHAIVPFFGQGANCAFEDTIEIDRLLDRHGEDWPRVLAEYESARKPNTDAIAEMALENHVEMSEKVNSRLFKAKSNAVHSLERRLPGRYVSRYELVSFSTTPYSKIKARIRKQNLVLLAALAAVAGAVVTASVLLSR